MAEVLIKYKADAGDLEAVVTKINKVNDEVVKGATDAGKRIGDEFRKAGATAAAAFASEQVKNAFKNLSSEADKLATELQKLQDEQLDLLATGKRVSKEYQDNAKAQAALKVSISEVNKELSKFTNTTEKTEKSQKSLTGQLRGLKQELTLLEQQGKDNTKEFNQLLIAASKLEDQIGDTRARVRILAADTFKFDAAVQATQGLAAGFEVAQGAAALFGSESEDLQKAILKVQGAIAVANGVQQIANLLLEESAIKTAILTAKQAIYTTVVGTSTGALKAFRIALAATGVGLLVLGLVALVENFDKVKAALENSIPGFKTVSNAIGDVVDTIKEWVGASDEAERAGAAFEKATKRQNDATKAIVDGYNRRIEVEKAAGRNTTQLEIEREKAVIEASKKILKDYQFKSTELIKLDEEQKQKAIDAAKEARDAILEAENNILVIKTEAAKKASDAANEAAKKQAAIQKEQFAKLLQETAELQLAFDKQLAEQRKANEAKFQVTLSDLADTSLENQLDDRLNFLKRLEIEEGSNLDRRINIIELEGKKRIAAAEGNANLIKLIEAETQQAIRDERKKSADEQLDQLSQIAEATADLFSNIIELQGIQSQKRIEEINAASEQEQLAIEQSATSEADKQRKLDALRLRTAQKVAAEKRKQAAAEKAAAIFEATIGTAVAVAKAPDPIQKAIALAAGLAQIAIIAATPIPKFKRGGMVGGRSHDSGGTIIEAERGEFVVNRNAVSRHRTELDALNTSSAAFKRLIDERYVRPALNYYMGKKERHINVNASLNSKSMERELKGMRRDLKRNNTVININGNDSRYSWHLN